MKEISMIVTVYNRLEFLRNLIMCLKNQSIQIKELIIADDGSREVAKEAISDLIEDCRFDIIHTYQEDLGFRLSRSRNNGAKAATGDYLIFVDQDLIFDDNFVEKFMDESSRETVTYIKSLVSTEEEMKSIQKLLDSKSSYKEIINEISTEEKQLKNKMYKKDILYNVLNKLKLRKNRGAKLSGVCFGLYKEDYIKINGFDEKYQGWGCEDDDFCNRSYAAKFKVKPISPGAIHMYHPFDPTKRASPNDEYYKKRKKEIFKMKDYNTEYGYKNSIDLDEVKTVKIG